MRIDKYLSDSTAMSRKEIKLLLKNGKISRNGVVIKDAKFQVEKSDEVCVNGKTILYQKYIYLMLNKPDGYVSATYDKHLPVVTDLLPAEFVHFNPFPVGRLDIDTHGLLILTNDGELAHRLLSPKNHVKKTYFVKSDLLPTRTDILAFESGIQIDDDFTALPAKLIIDNPNENTAYITIYEGKFHQIKRMYEAVGKKVTYLKRVSMGNLPLDEALTEGEIRPLTEEEMKRLCEKL